MAGLVGYRSTGVSAPPAVFLEDLARGIDHRGPDAFGAWWDRDAGIGLAHRLRASESTGPHRAQTPRRERALEEGTGSTGAGPVLSTGGRWVLVVDGRVDNRVEIRSALGDPTPVGSGAELEGRSGDETRPAPMSTIDAHLLAEAFDRWGPELALERLDGPFALAAWDREDRRLVLARDALGQRPLVYSFTGRGIVFASELGALRRVPGFDTSLDPAAVALFLRFKYVPSPHTIHPGAWKLPPGHVLTLSAADLERGRTPEPRRLTWFTDLVTGSHGAQRTGGVAAEAPMGPNGSDAPPGGTEAAEWLDHLDAVLGRSVHRLLSPESDADGTAGAGPGSLLSGGIDSTLVSAIAAEQSSTPLQTFTVGSDDPDLDESAEARAIAAHLGARHTEVPIDGADARDEVPRLASRWDEPFADSSQLPMLLVSRLARGSVESVVVGDGGDELFGGYNRHLWLPSTWARVGRVPAPLRRGAALLLAAPPPAAWDRAATLIPARRRPRMTGLKAAKFASVLGATDVADAYGRLVSHWQDPTSLLTAEFTEAGSGATGTDGEFAEPVTLAHDVSNWPRRGSLAETIMAVDLCTYLPDDVMVKVDRATAAAGLETRAPLLGREVIEASFALPLDHKIADGVGKRALRDLIARRLPPELVERPKSGFGVPIAGWLRGPLRPWAEDLLAEDSIRRGGLLRPEPIRAVWAQHLTGRVDRSFELWDVLMLLDWVRGHEAVGR